jgi:hypothetical protein
VWRFIEHLALFHDLTQEPIAVPFLQTLLDLVGRSDVKVERERPLEREVNPDSLIDRISRRHDDQQIDVALLVRRAVSVGAEQDDLLRMEAFGEA